MDEVSRAYLVGKTCRFLNECLIADPEAINKLFNTQIKCNEMLTNHPYLHTLYKDGEYYVTVLGLINGMLGPKRIARHVKDGSTIEFKIDPIN